MVDINREKDKPLEPVVPTHPHQPPLVDSTINPATLPSLEQEVNFGKKEREETGGEIGFDRGVYTVIGLGVNEIGALGFTDVFKDGAGKKWFDGISGWLAKTFEFTEKKILKEGKLVRTISPQESAASALLTAALLFSGTLLVWPMKALEDSKAYWVKKGNHYLDRWRKHKLTEEEVAARDKEVEQAIACQPKQSWPTLLIGRTVAMVVVMGNSMFLMGPERMEKIGHFSENILTRPKHLWNALMSPGRTWRAGIRESFKESVQPVNPGKPKNFWHRQANLMGIETLCCTLSSVVLELSSKFFARSNAKPRQPEICAGDAAPPAAAGGNASSGDEHKKSPVAAVIQQENANAKHPDNFKKKKTILAPKQTHAAEEIARAQETNYTLAP